MTTINLTERSLQVFKNCAEEANEWGGYPWVCMIPDLDFKRDRGNLSDLIKKGLIRIDDNDGKKNPRSMNIVFTDAGRAFALELGITIS